MSYIFHIRATFILTLINLRNFKTRIGASLSTVIGFAGVVAVFVSVLSMSEGFNKVLTTLGSEDVAIIIRDGSNSEINSSLTLQETRIISNIEGVELNNGTPLVSSESLVVVNAIKKRSAVTANLAFRGVSPNSFIIHDKVKIEIGRTFNAGTNEIIVGKGAQAQFRGIDIGNIVTWNGFNWKVVGTFSAHGGIYESEVWADVSVLQSVYNRLGSFQSVYVKLTSPASFGKLEKTLQLDPRLRVKAQRETDYFSAQAEALYKFITSVGFIIALLMSVGAIFGAANIMYSVIAARSKEIATLRALGFHQLSIISSVLIESMLLGFIGSIFGGIIAFVLYDGLQTSTFNTTSFSQVVFAFTITPQLLISGIKYGLLMGLIGGILPGFRAARLNLSLALRGT